MGSERTVTNSSQTVIGTITFEGFGQTVATTGSSANPYKFAAVWGYRDDGDAGLLHVGARYYDAQVGRFITRDTELEEHPYLYCEHNPVCRVDPSGHWAASVGLGGAVGSGPFGGSFDIGIAFDGDWNVGISYGVMAGIGNGIGLILGPDVVYNHTGHVHNGAHLGWGGFAFGAMELGALIKTLFPFSGGSPSLGGGFHGGSFGVGVGAGGYYGIGGHATIKLFNLMDIWRWIRKYI